MVLRTNRTNNDVIESADLNGIASEVNGLTTRVDDNSVRIAALEDVPVLSVVELLGNDPSLVWTAGWGQYDAVSNTVVYARYGKIHTLGGAIRYTGAALTNATAAAGSYTVMNFGDSIIAPPKNVVNLYVGTHLGDTTSGKLWRLMIRNNGLLTIQQLRNLTTSETTLDVATNEYFTFSATWIV